MYSTGYTTKNAMSMGAMGNMAQAEAQASAEEIFVDTATYEAIAEHALSRLQVDAHGLDPMDRRYLETMIEKFGEYACDKKLCKAAIRTLMDSGRCVYTYFGGSYVEIPHKEASAND